MKKMMKKVTALSMAFVLLLGLCACGSGAEEKAQEPEVKEEEVKETPSEEPATEAAEEGEDQDSSEEQAAFKPEKDISFIVGFDAGGTADIPARIVAKYMSKYAGVNVVVSNITGSGGQVAAEQVKAMEPDGYTLLHVPVGYYLQAALGNADFTYEDFTPVTMWCDSWVALVVNADSPYETYEDFIVAVKENPDTIRMGTVSGTLPQLAALAIQEKEQISFKMVDIGVDTKATELMSNRIDAYIDGVGNLSQYVESGDFRLLMAFSKEGTVIPSFEDLPSAASLGYSDFDYLLQSFGMWMPKGTDEAVVQYYADLVKQCSEDPECIAELNALGYGARSEDPKTYAQICADTQEQTNQAVADILE